MAFDNINSEQKLHCYISEKTDDLIRDDMLIFSVDRLSAFVNLVLHNYWRDSKMSVNYYLSERRREMQILLKKSGVAEGSENKIIDAFHEEEKKDIMMKIDEKKKRRGCDLKFRLNNENAEILMSPICIEDTEYKKGAGSYVKCILEDYAELPFIERERIVKKHIYDKINNSLRGKTVIWVVTETQGEKTRYVVEPYKIISDVMNTRDYLVCYSRKDNEEYEKRKAASFSLARIIDVKDSNEISSLCSDDIQELEKFISERTPAYLLEESYEIHVKFTPEGEKLYRRKLYSRPERVYRKDDEYIFTCTENQAFNYFLPFLGEVEIVSPDSLRQRLYNAHKKAADRYEV